MHTHDRGCAWPGRNRPPPWRDTHHTHHIHHRANGGTTSINNLIMLCRRHHDTYHHTEWHIRIHDGTPEFIPPTWTNPNRTPRRNPTRASPVSAATG